MIENCINCGDMSPIPCIRRGAPVGLDRYYLFCPKCFQVGPSALTPALALEAWNNANKRDEIEEDTE